MKIYTDEFIQSLEKIEDAIGVRMGEISDKLNMDSMIECRNISKGDTNEFGNGTYVVLKYNTLNIKDEFHHANRKSFTVEDLGKKLSDKVEKYIMQMVEDKINSSEITITKARDIRKMFKVLLDQDVIIENSLNLRFRFTIVNPKEDVFKQS